MDLLKLSRALGRRELQNHIRVVAQLHNDTDTRKYRGSVVKWQINNNFAQDNFGELIYQLQT